MSDLTLVFLTRPGCHLCDQARPLVLEIAAKIGAEVEERDVDADPGLRQLYGERVPVLLTGDGVVVAEGLIGAARRLERRLRRMGRG